MTHTLDPSITPTCSTQTPMPPSSPGRTPASVRKRDGRSMPFDATKITVALKKALQASNVPNADFEAVDITGDVVAALARTPIQVPEVEQIQDMVEEALMRRGLIDTARRYILYRQDRARARELNAQLMRTFEEITYSSSQVSNTKRENANIDADTAMGCMLKFGSEGAKRFNALSVLRPEHAKAHQNGDIHIHDLDFLTLTTTCCQIELRSLLRGGFSTGHGHLREPRSIASYAALACIAVQSNQNDQHGGQSITDFDYAMADGVALTFAATYCDELTRALVWSGAINADIGQAHNLVSQAIAKTAGSLGVRLPLDGDDVWDAAEQTALAGVVPGVDAGLLASLRSRARALAQAGTDRATYQAMEAFIANLNTMNSRAGAQTPFSSINYGLCTSAEGRMAMRNLLSATEAGLGDGETAIFPIQIFRVAAGVNLNAGDPNYDLFQHACRCSAARLFPNFAFQDAAFNAEYYVPGRPETEVAYMGCRTRVLANAHDPSRQISARRGNLSFTSVNLPRLAIKAHGGMNAFYRGLDQMLNLVIDQLLERFEIQARKKVRNFPFLMGQGVWLDSEKLGPDDTVREVLKHGTLGLGFIGLAETLIMLTGEHHGQSEAAQQLGLEIIGRMRQRTDQATAETGLNFSLLATPAEGLAGRFVQMDRQRYGTITGVTDKQYYTNSFHIPVDFAITTSRKIDLEAPYHALTNGGHISYVELDGDLRNNVEAFASVVRYMANAGIGYGSINHPIDRDPVCGFTGVIADECPRCGRAETSDVPFERIRRITGYLVGSLERFNDAKRAEVADRVVHTSLRPS